MSVLDFVLTYGHVIFYYPYWLNVTKLNLGIVKKCKGLKIRKIKFNYSK